MLNKKKFSEKHHELSIIIRSHSHNITLSNFAVTSLRQVRYGVTNRNILNPKSIVHFAAKHSTLPLSLNSQSSCAFFCFDNIKRHILFLLSKYTHFDTFTFFLLQRTLTGDVPFENTTNSSLSHSLWKYSSH
jgi:hypothetical protein